MFIVALLIGLFAYAVFILGLLGGLQFPYLQVITLLFSGALLYVVVSTAKQVKVSKWGKCGTLEKTISLLLIVTALIHLIGALSPEIYFDALWYHLTIPKIYLQNHAISYLPGKLFYYSAMPQLIEMLYVPALAFGTEITAKLIHYVFALLTAVTIIKIGKDHMSRLVGLLAALVFLTDLSVAWLSSTAYIDLGRTFFETVAFYYLVKWSKNNERVDLIKSGLILGFAVSSKYLALGTVGIVGLFTLFINHKHRLVNALYFSVSTALSSFVWFLYSFFNTDNPVYPLFSENLDSSHQLFTHSITDIFISFFRLSNFPHDWLSPISPLYFLFLPIALYLGKSNFVIRLLSLYGILGYIVWFFIPQTGGSRFIVPYLPVFALLVAYAVINATGKLRTFLISIAILAVGFNLLVRVYVNKKFVPVLVGLQTKHDYLTKNLNFGHVFYDIERRLADYISPEDRVLIRGGHSLYYVPFNFDHESYLEVIDPNNYSVVVTQYLGNPDERDDKKLVYYNQKSQIAVYK